jgi:hypothetical protein
MTDFIRVDIESHLSNEEIFSIFLTFLPNFKWKKGDSDSQGNYITGTDSGKVKIQCWTDEKPVAFSISFRSTTMKKNDMDIFSKLIISKIIPKIGNILKINI